MNVEKVVELQLVDDGLVYPLGVSYLVFPSGKSIDCDGFYVKQYHVRFIKIISGDYCITYNI